MRKTMALAAAFGLAASLGAAAPALAGGEEACGKAPRDRWMNQEAARALATSLGFEVREMEADDGCYELEVADSAGKRFDLSMHPVTGEVVRTEEDD